MEPISKLTLSHPQIMLASGSMLLFLLLFWPQHIIESIQYLSFCSGLVHLTWHPFCIKWQDFILFFLAEQHPVTYRCYLCLFVHRIMDILVDSLTWLLRTVMQQNGTGISDETHSYLLVAYPVMVLLGIKTWYPYGNLICARQGL